MNNEDFLLDLISTDWNEKINHNDVETKMELLIKTTNDLINKHTPMKKVKSKNKNKKKLKPWITKGILKSIDHKNKLKIH